MRLLRTAGEAVLVFGVCATLWGCAALSKGAGSGAVAGAVGATLPPVPVEFGFWEWLGFTLASGLAYGGVSAIKGALRLKFFDPEIKPPIA